MCGAAAGLLIYLMFFANRQQSVQVAIGLCYFRIEKNMTDAIYAATLPVANTTDYAAYYAKLDFGKPVDYGSFNSRTFCEVLEASCRHNGTLQAMGCQWHENWGCECKV